MYNGSKFVSFTDFLLIDLIYYFQEHDHEAEQLVSTLSLNSEDDELDVGK